MRKRSCGDGSCGGMLHDPSHFIIWQNCDLDYEDWRDELEAIYPELSEEEGIDMMHRINDDYLEDERSNLDIDVGGEILMIGDENRFGTYGGYRFVGSSNISDCLGPVGGVGVWYVDKLGDLRLRCADHDGTYGFVYRVLRSGTSDITVDSFLEKLRTHKADRVDLNRVTKRLGEPIADVYGYSIAKHRIRRPNEDQLAKQRGE